MPFDFTDGQQKAKVAKYDSTIEITLSTEKPYSKLILAIWIVSTALIFLFGFNQIKILLDTPGQILVSDNTFNFAFVLAVDFAFIYPLCVLLFNKTIVHVDQDTFSLRHAPLWSYGAFSLPTSQITKIKIVEKEESVRAKGSFYTHKMTFYFLVLVTPTGKRKEISTLKSSEAMLSFVRGQLLSWFHNHYEKKQNLPNEQGKLGIWGNS